MCNFLRISNSFTLQNNMCVRQWKILLVWIVRIYVLPYRKRGQSTPPTLSCVLKQTTRQTISHHSSLILYCLYNLVRDEITIIVCSNSVSIIRRRKKKWRNYFNIQSTILFWTKRTLTYWFQMKHAMNEMILLATSRIYFFFCIEFFHIK